MCVKRALRRMITICGIDHPLAFNKDLRWFMRLTTIDGQVVLLGTRTRQKARNFQQAIKSASRQRNLNLQTSTIIKATGSRTFTDLDKLYNLEMGYHRHLLNDGVLKHGRFCAPSRELIPREFWV